MAEKRPTPSHTASDFRAKPKVRVLPVEPTGTTTALGCGPTKGMVPYEVKTYPRSRRGQHLRSAREALGKTMGQAARQLGISVVELSGLELGRYKLSVEDWAIVDSTLGIDSRPLCGSCGDRIDRITNDPVCDECDGKHDRQTL